MNNPESNEGGNVVSILHAASAPEPKGRELPHLKAVMEIARVAHEVVRGYRVLMGDDSCPPWEEMGHPERQSAAHQVITVLKLKHLTVAQMHADYVETERQNGWVYGETFNADLKHNPLLVPFDQLPEAQRIEDGLFANTVIALYC